MISLVSRLPRIYKLNAELVKIKCLFDAYKNDNKVLFWVQNDNKAVISMTDGNMIIFNNGADCDELKDFVNILSPACIYSDYDTLRAIDKVPKERINVVYRYADIKSDTKSDTLKSDEIACHFS